MDADLKSILKSWGVTEAFSLNTLLRIQRDLQTYRIRETELVIFPSLVEASHQSTLPEPTITDPAVRCFYDERKPAQYVCAKTGKFISSEYAICVEGKVYCTEFIHKQDERDDSMTIKEVVRYDFMVRGIAILSLIPFFWYFLWISGPACVVLSVWKFNSLKKHPLRPKRTWFYIGILFGLILIVAFAVAVLFFIQQFHSIQETSAG